jgi:K+-sensing histidine kinase KdpD
VVSEEEKEKIFTPYHRIDSNPAQQNTFGLGLGLAISKRIILLHDVDIWVENNPDGGNIFAFSLPLTDNIRK